MFFQMKIVLAIAFLAIMVSARGPTFPIGNGGLAIAHGDAVAHKVANNGLVARDGVTEFVSSVSSEVVPATEVNASSESALLKDEILTILEEITTTTVLITSVITSTDVYALSNSEYAAHANILSWNQTAYPLYTNTSTSTTKTRSSTLTMYTTVTLYEQTPTISSVAMYEDTPTTSSSTTIYTPGPKYTKYLGINTHSNTTHHKTSFANPGSFLNTAYPTLDFSGRDGPAPLQTGLRDYNAAGNGNQEKARKAAKASVFAGIALGVWMVIRIFL